MAHETYAEGHVPLGLSSVRILDGYIYATFRLIRPCRAGETFEDGVEMPHGSAPGLTWLGPKATKVHFVPLVWRIDPRADHTKFRGISMEPYFVVAPQLDFSGTDIGELLTRLVPR